MKKLQKKLAKTQRAINKFCAQTYKNYLNMKKAISKIWLMLAMICAIVSISSCNVTRTITTESKYFQKGDTTCTITTKTTETYDATKKI